ncbi:MAG: ABC transporter ATP-binding protein [Candidatus Methanomethylophilaceae archaeon]|nr:ABC transporter ATP-binding protein [Candidatus Methanomethylophilaceae archaeon]
MPQLPSQKEKPTPIGTNDTLDIQIRDLVFRYRTFPIIKGLNASFDKPELVSIIGPNGVGKSTLIHCINKILTPNDNAVMIDGRDVNTINVKELARHMGYVPYTSSNAFPITVIDAVMLGRHPHAKIGSFDKDLEISYQVLERLGIEELAMRHLNELSAGQLQKVILAKGLAQEPKVLLLDEPTANLDVKHQLGVTRLLKKISDEKKMTVVMICHDLNIAAKYSDRIIMMSEGTVYASGTPEEVLTRENIRKVYDIDCEVIMDQGRPHILLRDDEPQSSDS